MHILVTGGAGFIGSHIVQHHIDKGDSVYVLDDLSTGSLDNISKHFKNPHFKFEQVDILTWDKLKEAVFWSDRIYHMAAIVGMFRVMEEPTRVMAINVAGCERILRFMNESVWGPQIIIASSSEVYGSGSQGREFTEDDPLVVNSVTISRWNYAISKLADEALAMSYHKKFATRTTVVRFFNTVGPGQIGRYGMVLPRFVKQAVNNEPITVYGDGNQKRSFCDVRDTVNFLDELCNNSQSEGQIVNVGNNKVISILELAELVKELSKSSSKITFVSYKEAYGNDYEEVQNRKPDLTKLKSLTKYNHNWKLEDTIIDLINTEKNNNIRNIKPHKTAS